jgi:transcription initiation factor TFIIIB Brf1 subunit/transcription initiation factor TFIIB
MEGNIYLNPPQSLGNIGCEASSEVSCSECKGPLILDVVRGESYCDLCGKVEKENCFEDADQSNMYNSNSDSNPGRGVLEIGRAKFLTEDAYGRGLSSTTRNRFRRLENVSKTLDSQARALESNRVVEKTIEVIKQMMPYPSPEIIKRLRDELLKTQKSCQNKGDSLFKTGSKWNAEGAALACMNINDSRILFRNIKNRISELGLNKAEGKSLRKRALKISQMMKLHHPQHKNNHGSRTTGFLVPHDLDMDTTTIYRSEIRDYLDNRRTLLRKAGLDFPNPKQLLESISNILNDEQILQYSNRHIEPILDAILLVMLHKENPGLSRSEITEKVGLSSSSKSYTKMVSMRR